MESLANSNTVMMLYGIREVSNSDLDYFLDAFELKEGKIRENYLTTKEKIVDSIYRFKHYSPTGSVIRHKDALDRLLTKWENWFLNSIESSKGMRNLRVLYLKKKQFEVCGLDLPATRLREITTGYNMLAYQNEVICY